MSDLPFTPVVILGAPRSGTNALRDALTSLPGLGTWPCDEINPIWRHGNVLIPHDAFEVENARPRVRRFIRRAFKRIWEELDKPAFVVEKTCANTLRVPFVDAVLPEAKYIVITRDGMDVIASATRRWKGELEVPGLPYYRAKIRYTPLRDLPFYAESFLRARLALLLGRKRRLSVWGPRWPGMDALKDPDLPELCARQWTACVAATDSAIAEIDPARVLRISYEDFVADPGATLTATIAFLGHDVPEGAVQAAASKVHGGSVGKGRRLDVSDKVRAILHPTLTAHGYAA